MSLILKKKIPLHTPLERKQWCKEALLRRTDFTTLNHIMGAIRSHPETTPTRTRPLLRMTIEQEGHWDILQNKLNNNNTDRIGNSKSNSLLWVTQTAQTSWDSKITMIWSRTFRGRIGAWVSQHIITIWLLLYRWGRCNINNDHRLLVESTVPTERISNCNNNNLNLRNLRHRENNLETRIFYVQ